MLDRSVKVSTRKGQFSHKLPITTHTIYIRQYRFQKVRGVIKILLLNTQAFKIVVFARNVKKAISAQQNKYLLVLSGNVILKGNAHMLQKVGKLLVMWSI